MEHYDMEYPVTYITSKDKDELWIGTINGLYIFNKKQKQVLPANLSSDIGNINTIYQDSTLTTYIGTSGNGLWIYDNQTQKLDNYHTKNSALICNNIYSILPDKVKGDLIISTESELVHFKAKERLFLNWTKEQGLMAAQFNTASGIRTQQGVFAFGSSNGAVILRNGMKLPRTFNSKMVLNDFNIHYQRMLPNQEGSPLTLPIDDTKSITLSHDQNIFSLNVSSINYDCPSRILYSWKLEGFYDEWTTPSGNNLIRYTNISPGKYKLHIRSLLLDDGHTLEERTIAITITPPFSQSIWAIIIHITINAIHSSNIHRDRTILGAYQPPNTRPRSTIRIICYWFCSWIYRIHRLRPDLPVCDTYNDRHGRYDHRRRQQNGSQFLSYLRHIPYLLAIIRNCC
jgi:hypothetical protein